MKRKRKRMTVLSAAGFVGSYALIRYVLFDLHGMKDWSELLAGVSLVILVMALIRKKSWIALTAGLGYPVSFGIALLFARDGNDPGGGRTNNMWFIWAICLLIFILAGVTAEMAAVRKEK